MKKKRKTSSRRRQPTAKKRSWFSSLVFFAVGIVLAYLVLSVFPHLVPDRLQSTIRRSVHQVKQWRQEYWPSTKKSTVKKRKPPVAGKTSPPPSVAKKPAAATLYVTLYKATPDYDGLTGSSKLLTTPREGKVKLARMIFAELTRDDATSKSPLPPGVKLRAVSFAGRLIILDLSREIISGLANTGSRDEMLAVYGLVNTYLKNFPDCSEVQIKVEGRPVKTLAGHIEVNRPLTFFTEKEGRPFAF